MKIKVIIIIIVQTIVASFAFFSAISAQVTQEKADEIVLARLSQETQPYIIYAKEGVQTAMNIATIVGETLELDYPCWVYYASNISANCCVGRYLIVNESNGNLLEVKVKSNAGQGDLTEWRVVTNISGQTTGYIVGYETCGLTIEGGIGHAKGYVFISEDLKDTLAVYNLSQDIYSFPAEIFTVTDYHTVNMSFPEQYRNAFKIQLTYTLSSEEELLNRGLIEFCAVTADKPILHAYRNCIPVMANSASAKFVMWRACPDATIDDTKTYLNWAVLFDEMLRPYEFVNPDKFDIYIAQHDMSNFTKLIELNNDESYSYTVENLQNSNPYFFYLVSRKVGFKPLYSDTIMVIPDKRKEFEMLLMSDDNHTLWNVSIAQQKNKIAYVDGYYYWDGGSNCCMATSVLISNMDGSEKELVKTNSYHPCWSPAEDKIVFYFDGIHNVGWIPAQIALYDCETKSITQLTDDNYYNFAPVFSGNGELLLFQSSKNTPGTYETNIWLMNLKTLESFQVTDISGTSLRTVEQPRWIDNDRFLFHGVYHGEKYQLFESSVSAKQISKLFESQWNDYTPSISPDQKKIAFISNRSRTNQVWIYDMDSKSYCQITGYSNNESVGGAIQWLDNSTIVFTINGNQLVKQKVNN